jgi:Carboxypeptidase regulatory-like domain
MNGRVSMLLLALATTPGCHTLPRESPTGTTVLTVLDPDGRPVRDYRYRVRGAFHGEDGFGAPLIVGCSDERPDGTTILRDLPDFEVVVEVLVEGFVKCYSVHFERPSPNARPSRLAVRLDAEGGEVAGVVRDTGGRPIPNVHVETLPDGIYRGWRFVPLWVTTKASAKTNERGEYRLPRLYPGEYRVNFRHGSFCDQAAKETMVVRSKVARQDTVLFRGCLVTGIARVDGKPAAHVKIHIASDTFMVECNTDAEGRFRMPKSIPPGAYLIRAAEIRNGPFDIMMQFQQSKKAVEITDRDRRLEFAMDVKSRR